MAYVTGKNVKIYRGTSPILQLNDCSVSINSDEQDITDFGSEWVKNGQVLKGWSASIGGFLDNPSSQIYELLSALMTLSSVSVKFEYTFDDNSQIALSGDALVTNFTIDSSPDNYVTVSIDLVGSGELTVI